MSRQNNVTAINEAQRVAEPFYRALEQARMTLIDAHAASRGVGPAQDDVAQLEYECPRVWDAAYDAAVNRQGPA
jgi:hypothetical protein